MVRSLVLLLVTLLQAVLVRSIRGHERVSEAANHPSTQADQDTRQRVKLMLEATDAGDCGVQDLTKRLLAKSSGEEKAELEWDDITDNIDWSTIDTEFDAYFHGTDKFLLESEAKLKRLEADLSNIPPLHFVEREKIVKVVMEHVPKGYCSGPKERGQFLKIRGNLYTSLVGLAKPGSLALDVGMIKEVFHKAFPESLTKSKKGAASVCFELKHGLCSDLNIDPSTSVTDRRRPLETELRSVVDGIESNKAMRAVCETRRDDLKDFEHQLTTLKRKRDETVHVLDDTEQSITTLTKTLGDVKNEISSLTRSQDKVVAEIHEAQNIKLPKLKKDMNAAKGMLRIAATVASSLEQALVDLAANAALAANAVKAAETVKAKVAMFAQVFLETYRQAVKAPLQGSVGFKIPLDKIVKIAQTMEDVKFQEEPESQESFKQASTLLVDLNKFCTEEGIPALNAISSVNVNVMTKGKSSDFTPSAICDNKKIRNSEDTMAGLSKHIQDKRARVAQAVKELAAEMADDDEFESAEDSVLEQQGDMPGLRRFAAIGPPSIYEDYLKHWRVTGASTPGKGGASTFKRGLYLELVLGLRNVVQQLKQENRTSTSLYKKATSMMKASTSTLDALRGDMTELVTKTMKDGAEKRKLEKEILTQKRVQSKIKGNLQKLDETVNDLQDDLAKVENLIVTTHAEIKASLLELGLAENDFEMHYSALLDEIMSAKEPFALRGLVFH